jgi:hypothetical protein
MNDRIKLKTETLLIIFVLSFGLLNLIQALLTPLNPDEAYYWMYSRYPAWGYYDHPPAIALMIKAGYAIIKNELGLRLFVVISQAISFFLLWLLLDKEKKKESGNVTLLFLLIFSLPAYNMFGFFATPDSPLLFFEALFLYLYKRFSEKNDWASALLLGVTMAAIMYSKYHGALLIILVALSDLRLLRNPKAYVALALSLLLFVPHIVWQYNNNFPTLNYHLIDRAYVISFKEFPEYILNTLVIHNPLIFPAGLLIVFGKKNKEGFERTLTFIIAGVLIFFLLASFRYHVEPHWTALIAMPITIIIFNNIDFTRPVYRYFKPALYFSAVIIIIARSALMFDILPVKFIKKNYHESKNRFLEIKKIAGEKPVVFTNSYQNASKYTFYTGNFSHSLNNLNYRKTQYDLWKFEEEIYDKNVLYVPHFLEGGYKEKLDKYRTSDGDTIYAKEYTGFRSLQRECCIIEGVRLSFRKEDTCNLELVIFNPYPYSLDLKNETFPIRFQAGFFQQGQIMYNQLIEFSPDLSYINPGDSVSLTARFTINDLAPGKYKIAICTETGIEYITYNSKFKDCTVRE